MLKISVAKWVGEKRESLMNTLTTETQSKVILKVEANSFLHFKAKIKIIFIFKDNARAIVVY